jgi:hypothetical protein
MREACGLHQIGDTGSFETQRPVRNMMYVILYKRDEGW